jgi:hypothetical protein
MDTTGDLIGSFIDRIAGLDRKIGTAIDVVTKIKDLFSIFYGVFDELYTEIMGQRTMLKNIMDNMLSMVLNLSPKQSHQ